MTKQQLRAEYEKMGMLRPTAVDVLPTKDSSTSPKIRQTDYDSSSQSATYVYPDGVVLRWAKGVTPRGSDEHFSLHRWEYTEQLFACTQDEFHGKIWKEWESKIRCNG